MTAGPVSWAVFELSVCMLVMYVGPVCTFGFSVPLNGFMVGHKQRWRAQRRRGHADPELTWAYGGGESVSLTAGLETAATSSGGERIP